MSLNLMFNKERVDGTRDPLTRLERVIFHRNKITHKQFQHQHYEVFSEKLTNHRTLAVHLNNLRRSMMKEEIITWMQFWKVITEILKFNLISVSVVLRDPLTKEDVTYSSNDIISDDEGPSAPETSVIS